MENRGEEGGKNGRLERESEGGWGKTGSSNTSYELTGRMRRTMEDREPAGCEGLGCVKSARVTEMRTTRRRRVERARAEAKVRRDESS